MSDDAQGSTYGIANSDDQHWSPEQARACESEPYTARASRFVLLLFLLCGREQREAGHAPSHLHAY
jgi:hypothetical protein